MHKLSHILKPLSLDYLEAYLADGFQLHDILEWALLQTGIANVTIMTFSFSEEFIRKIYFLKKTGLIGEITVIVDFKAVQKTQKIIRLTENVFDQVIYASSHAKILLIESSSLMISILGSQNATRGNRLESGIITTDLSTYSTINNGIETLILNAKS